MVVLEPCCQLHTGIVYVRQFLGRRIANHMLGTAVNDRRQRLGNLGKMANQKMLRANNRQKRLNFVRLQP